jgi:hypothetical protein
MYAYVNAYKQLYVLTVSVGLIKAISFGIPPTTNKVYTSFLIYFGFLYPPPSENQLLVHVSDSRIVVVLHHIMPH